jgi:predicted AAA+ superfamily ATPase
MNLQTSSLSKLEKLFYFIAHTLPSELNYKSLAEKIGISKDLLETIIYYLDQI